MNEDSSKEDVISSDVSSTEPAREEGIEQVPKLEEVTEFSGDKWLDIYKIAKTFLDKGISQVPPQFVIFTGGIAAGKTTIRRQLYPKDYVHFDFGEIYQAIEKAFGKDSPRIVKYSALATDMIFNSMIQERKNIVIEIIGENINQTLLLAPKMKEIGYEIHIGHAELNLEKARARHLKAVEEDTDYMSAFHTQEATLAPFFTYFGLGDVPLG